MPAAPTMRRRTWSTTAIPKTGTAGRWLAVPSSTLPGGDMIGFNVCYSEGAAGLCTNQRLLPALQQQQQRGPRPGSPTASSPPAPRSSSRGCGVLLPRTSTSGTRNGGPRSVGGYVNVDYNGTATNLILRDSPGGTANCGVVAAGAGATTFSSSAPGQQLQPRLQLLGSLYPHPVEPGAAARYRSANCCITHTTPPSKAPAVVGSERLASRRLQRGHRRPERLVRDVPLAAQLLSMIA